MMPVGRKLMKKICIQYLLQGITNCTAGPVISNLFAAVALSVHLRHVTLSVDCIAAGCSAVVLGPPTRLFAGLLAGNGIIRYFHRRERLERRKRFKGFHGWHWLDWLHGREGFEWFEWFEWRKTAALLLVIVGARRGGRWRRHRTGNGGSQRSVPTCTRARGGARTDVVGDREGAGLRA